METKNSEEKLRNRKRHEHDVEVIFRATCTYLEGYDVAMISVVTALTNVLMVGMEAILINDGQDNFNKIKVYLLRYLQEGFEEIDKRQAMRKGEN
jgi:hypothetical protein